MTEKRFRYDWKTGRFKDTRSKSCATSNMRVLETLINDACYGYEKKIKKLEKENQELKQQLDSLQTKKNLSSIRTHKKITGLMEENKQLKKQMNRLYNYFMDWHSDEMDGNQFSEMWNIVKESEKWEKR